MLFHDDVLCVGSAVVDRFLLIDVPFSTLHLGDKILVKRTETHSGGSATNSVAALSRLGLKVSLLAKLGEDHDAEIILKELKKYSLRNLCRFHSQQNTDTSTIVSSSREHNRIIFTHKGASQDLRLSDLKPLPAILPRWIYLGSLVGPSFAVAKALAKITHKSGTKLLFNPSLYLAQKGKNYLRPILQATTILVLNKEEAETLVGKVAKSTIKKSAGKDVVDGEKSLEKSSMQLLHSLSAMGPASVVITDGKNKIWAIHEGKIYSVLPPQVRVVETTGAGDAFASSLLAGIIREWPFEDCLRLGLINSASVLQQVGAKNNLRTWREALLLMKRTRIKVKIRSVIT